MQRQPQPQNSIISIHSHTRRFVRSQTLSGLLFHTNRRVQERWRRFRVWFKINDDFFLASSIRRCIWRATPMGHNIPSYSRRDRECDWWMFHASSLAKSVCNLHRSRIEFIHLVYPTHKTTQLTGTDLGVVCAIFFSFKRFNRFFSAECCSKQTA